MRRLGVILLISAALCSGAPRQVHAGGDKVKDPYSAAETYYAQRDWKRALQLYRRALSVNDVRAHYRMGRIYEQTGSARDAIFHYRRYLELGQPGLEWNDAAQRLRGLENAQAKKAPGSQTLLERGRSLYAAGKFQEAETVLLEAVRAEETNPEAHFYLGEVYYELGQYEKAQRHFLKAKENY